MLIMAKRPRLSQCGLSVKYKLSDVPLKLHFPPGPSPQGPPHQGSVVWSVVGVSASCRRCWRHPFAGGVLCLAAALCVLNTLGDLAFVVLCVGTGLQVAVVWPPAGATQAGMGCTCASHATCPATLTHCIPHSLCSPPCIHWGLQVTCPDTVFAAHFAASHNASTQTPHSCPTPRPTGTSRPSYRCPVEVSSSYDS